MSNFQLPTSNPNGHAMPGPPGQTTEGTSIKCHTPEKLCCAKVVPSNVQRSSHVLFVLISNMYKLMDTRIQVDIMLSCNKDNLYMPYCGVCTNALSHSNHSYLSTKPPCLLAKGPTAALRSLATGSQRTHGLSRCGIAQRSSATMHHNASQHITAQNMAHVVFRDFIGRLSLGSLRLDNPMTARHGRQKTNMEGGTSWHTGHSK